MTDPCNEMKKIVVILIMVMLTLLIGCSVIEENKSLKAKNKELEQKIQDLDQRIKELENTISTLKQNDLELDICLERAKSNRENNLKLNDTEHKKGKYSLPTPVFEHIQNVYRDDCEECYRKYGRR